jgi:uncharacterized protein (UPF0261 family)
MMDVVVAVLATLDSKNDEARFVCEVLAQAGVKPCLIDLSLRPHNIAGADHAGGDLAKAAGASWDGLGALDRAKAGDIMIAGATKVLQELRTKGNLSGAIGLGGANGTSMGCTVMRSLPPLFPKVMVSAVAATAAVQWYVAESDIAMFPSIGDVAMNRITRAVMQNAATATAAMAQSWAQQDQQKTATPLIGVSTFGVTAPCVDHITDRLTAAGHEVIEFHASGPGGKALESLSKLGQLSGVIDVTTHELADLIVDGVYSAGDGRLREAGAAALPQVVVPGAIDFSNFWVGHIPEKFKSRAFFQFNAQNILMRSNADEMRTIGKLMAERLSAAKGAVKVLIPSRGFSENTKRMTHDINGIEVGPWSQPDVDKVFTETLHDNMLQSQIQVLDLHINDPAFADACVDAYLEMTKS